MFVNSCRLHFVHFPPFHLRFLQFSAVWFAWMQDRAEQAAAADAARFKAAYDAAVQQKLTHQQHHVHPWGASQQTCLPPPACRKKNALNKCKHGFPRPPNPRCRVICRGNARKVKLSARGRRNALGTVLGRRQSRSVAVWHLPSVRLDAHGQQSHRLELPRASNAQHARSGLRSRLPWGADRPAASASHRPSGSPCHQVFHGVLAKTAAWAKKIELLGHQAV